MDSTQVGVFKKATQIGLPCLLQSSNSCTLEAQICFEVLSNFPHQTLEGKFANQKFSGLLITSNFTECPSTRPVTMRFLHPSSRGRTLASGFCSELLPRCFTTGLFAGSLLCTSHSEPRGELTGPAPRRKSNQGCGRCSSLYRQSFPSWAGQYLKVPRWLSIG